jgi:hypothetical protein
MAIKFDDRFLSELQKGSIVTQGEVLELAGLSIDEVITDPQAANLAAMNVCSALERALWANGKRWSCRVVNLSVRILTDAESVVFQARRLKSGIRKVRRAHKHNMHIDDSALDEAGKRLIELERMKSSRSIIALSKAVRDANRVSRPTVTEKFTRKPKTRPVVVFRDQANH